MDASSGTEAPSGSGRWKDAAFSVSLANLLFMRTWHGLFSDSDFGYSHQIPVGWPVTLAFLLNLAWVAAVIYFITRQARRRSHRLIRALVGAALGLALLLVANFIRTEHFGHFDPAQLALLKHPVAWLLGAGLAVATWRWRSRVVRGVFALIVIVSPLVAWNVLRATLIPLGVFPLAQQGVEPRPVAPRPGPVATPRVLWVLFDEMDRRVAFDQRPAWLRLPEFDRLRGESLDATNAVPPGRDTIYAVPALTLGRFLAGAAPRAANDLSFVPSGDSNGMSWSTQTTVFSEVAALGANVGVVGWYHPYHRVFPRAISLGGWVAAFGDVRGESLGTAMLNQICSGVPAFQHRRTHGRVHAQTRAMALELLGQTNWGLAFLHLPMPHRPGIFNPETGRLTTTEFRPAHGYLANLQLADRTWGELRAALERTGTWNDTWVIVSSDHWWRDSAIYDGRVDLRVPFLIRPPRGSPPRIFPARMNTVVTHDLILALMKREISEIDELESWLMRHRVEEGPVMP